MEVFNLADTLVGQMLRDNPEMTENECVDFAKELISNATLSIYRNTKIFDRSKSKNGLARTSIVSPQQQPFPKPNASSRMDVTETSSITTPAHTPSSTVVPNVVAAKIVDNHIVATTTTPIVAIPVQAPKPQNIAKPTSSAPVAKNVASPTINPGKPVLQELKSPAPKTKPLEEIIKPTAIAAIPEPEAKLQESKPKALDQKAVAKPTETIKTIETPKIPAVSVPIAKISATPSIVTVIDDEEDGDDQHSSTTDTDSQAKKRRGTVDHVECATRVMKFIAFVTSTEYKAFVAEHGNVVPVPDELLKEASDGLVEYRTDPNNKKAFIRSIGSHVKQWVSAYEKQVLKIEKAKQATASGVKKAARKPKSVETLSTTTIVDNVINSPTVAAPAPQLLPSASIAASSKVSADSLVSGYVANLKSTSSVVTLTPVVNNEKKRTHDQILDKPAVVAMTKPKATTAVAAPKKSAPPAPKKRKLVDEDDEGDAMDLDGDSEDDMFMDDEEDDEEADFVDEREYVSGEEDEEEEEGNSDVDDDDDDE